MKNTKTLKRLLASAVAAATMMSVAIVPTRAAGEINDPALVFSPRSISSTVTTSAVTFTLVSAVPAGGTIHIDVPATVVLGANVPAIAIDGGASADMTCTGSDVAGYDCSFTSVAGQAIANSVVITFASDINVATTPAGDYTFGLYTLDAAGSPIDEGSAELNISPAVSIEALVVEALIMTVDSTGLDLVVDPSVNAGLDNGEDSVLTVKTNALTYNINAQITNSQSNDSGLYFNDGGTARYIPLYNGALADNYFGIDSNNDGTMDGTTPTSTGSTILSNEAGMTNSKTHTVGYELNVDYTTRAGIYTGTLIYTAVPTF